MAENRKGTTILSRELTRSTIRGSFQFYAVLHGSLYLVRACLEHSFFIGILEDFIPPERKPVSAFGT
jgi:hypothetical protein